MILCKVAKLFLHYLYIFSTKYLGGKNEKIEGKISRLERFEKKYRSIKADFFVRKFQNNQFWLLEILSFFN